jgi:O-antigen ligase
MNNYSAILDKHFHLSNLNIPRNILALILIEVICVIVITFKFTWGTTLIVGTLAAIITGIFILRPYWNLICYTFMVPFHPWIWETGISHLILGMTFLLIISATFLILQERCEINITTLVQCLFLFLISLFLSLSVSVDLMNSFKELRTLIGLMMVVFLIRYLVDDIKKTQEVVIVLIIATAISSMYAVVSIVISGIGRAGGFATDPNHFALELSMIIPLTIVTFQNTKGFLKRTLLLSVLTLFNITLLMTVSRGGILAVISIFLFFLWRERRIKAALLGGIIGAIIIKFMVPQWVWQMFVVSERATSAASRLDILRAGFKIFLDHPILGVGLGNFRIVFPHYTTFYFTKYKQFYAHNTYLEILTGVGLLGLITYLLIIGWYFTHLHKCRKSLSYNNDRKTIRLVDGLEASMISFLVASSFLSVLSYLHFWIILGLGGALDKIVKKKMLTRCK